MYFRQVFNQNLKASSCLWWCFCVFQPAGSHIWYPGFQYECGGGGVLLASYWSPWNHIWLPAALLCTFLYPSRLGLTVESLQSHMILMDYLFASRHKGHRFKSPGGDLCETGILLLALSRYITIEPLRHILFYLHKSDIITREEEN